MLSGFTISGRSKPLLVIILALAGFAAFHAFTGKEQQAELIAPSDFKAAGGQALEEAVKRRNGEVARYDDHRPKTAELRNRAHNNHHLAKGHEAREAFEHWNLFGDLRGKPYHDLNIPYMRSVVFLSWEREGEKRPMIGDGDSFTVLNVETGLFHHVRLLAVDAPEVDQHPWGCRSAELTYGLLLGDELYARILSADNWEQPKDDPTTIVIINDGRRETYQLPEFALVPYGVNYTGGIGAKATDGRVLGELILADGTSLGVRLIDEGLAVWTETYAPDFHHLRDAQATARASELGLWRNSELLRVVQYEHELSPALQEDIRLLPAAVDLFPIGDAYRSAMLELGQQVLKQILAGVDTEPKGWLTASMLDDGDRERLDLIGFGGLWMSIRTKEGEIRWVSSREVFLHQEETCALPYPRELVGKTEVKALPLAEGDTQFAPAGIFEADPGDDRQVDEDFD